MVIIINAIVAPISVYIYNEAFFKLAILNGFNWECTIQHEFDWTLDEGNEIKCQLSRR